MPAGLSLRIIEGCVAAAPDLPPALWWVAAAVAAILLAAALIDLWTGIVPDILIAAGLTVLIAAMDWRQLWLHAGLLAARGTGAALIIWAANRLWRAAFRHDALGMGDAKWTALAVAAFGAQAGLVWAWGAGALLASLILLACQALRRPLPRIRFAPFLLIGLGCGLYWDRIRWL